MAADSLSGDDRRRRHLLILFGLIALQQVPVQLTPTVDEPTITVTTVWPGASPQEIEREIVDEQEEQLKSLEGLLEMESSSSDSSGYDCLDLSGGNRHRQRAAQGLEPTGTGAGLSGGSRKPVISSVDVNENAIGWFILMPTDERQLRGRHLTLYDFVDDYVKPEIERVPGVGLSNFFGGRERELQVIVDPAKLASRRVTFNELAAALERENRNYSGGDFDEGKRRYIVRTVGEYQSPQDIEDIVIAVRDGVPIYLRDVGRAELGLPKAGSARLRLGRAGHRHQRHPRARVERARGHGGHQGDGRHA